MRQYTYGTDLISQRQLISGNWAVSYYGYDGHGSVRFLTDQTGAVTDTYTYDAFGTLIGQAGATPNEYLFAGEQIDPNEALCFSGPRSVKTERKIDCINKLKTEPETPTTNVSGPSFGVSNGDYQSLHCLAHK